PALLYARARSKGGSGDGRRPRVDTVPPGAVPFARMADPTPMRERRRLTPVEEGGAADVFVQESPAPVLQDDWPDGFDYVCGHCGEMVLASCVADDQLWALGFRCFA